MEQGKDEKKQCMAGVSSGRVIISGSAEETDGDGVEITAGEGVLLQVNGQTVDGSRRVCARDEIEIAPLQLQMPARIEVKIAKDEMEAQAVYFAPREIHYVIPDHPPAAELVISASKTEVEAAHGAGFSPVDIRNTLQARGVVYGLDEAALSGLISKPGKWRVIATGHPPVQGRDGYVEPLFKEGLQQINYDLAETHVDYRKRYEIPQVEKDQVIARIYPPRSGEPGMTVTGVKIPPEPVYPAEMFLETGTALNDAQNEVVALGSGVPVYRVRGKQVIVKVDNIYTHRGDVDVLSGHINFEGHLRIEGGIGEGLCVKAEGDIEIADNGSGAEIIAGGSIVFKKNCIKCLVRAGEQTLRIKEFSRFYNDLTDNLHLAFNMGGELAGELQKRGLYTEPQVNAILRSLIQKKLPHLEALSGKALSLSREILGESSKEAEAVLEECQLLLQGGGLLSLGKLHELYELLHENRGRWLSAAPGENMANISVYYVQNSSLLCPGDIFVNGPGAYNTQINCGGEVHIERIFRGGSIKAGGDIYIGEAGVPRLTRIEGLIETDNRKQVYLGRVYENTGIRIGKQEFYLEKDLSNIRIYRDQKGDIKISRWN